jgi:hypothetical protein
VNSGRIQSSNLVKEDSQDAIVSCSICDRYTRTAVDVYILVGKRGRWSLLSGAPTAVGVSEPRRLTNVPVRRIV